MASTIPWWISTPLAVAIYLTLRHFGASISLEAGTEPAADMAHQTMLKLLFSIGQYVLPGALIIGALASLIQGLRDRTQPKLATGNDAARTVQEMDWREFESLVGQAFEVQGYRVTRTGGDGPDGGVDLMLQRGGETFLVQCKHWRAFRVGVQVVRELYGVMAAQGATGGHVVTSGRFTEEAQAFARGRNIHLIDGPELQRLLREVNPRPSRTKPPATRLDVEGDANPIDTGLQSSPPPSCPRCGKPMVERTARRGERAGEAFWGCRDYPACRGMRPTRP